MIILDTHVLLWLDRQDPALGPVSRERIDADPADRLIVATSLARGARHVTADPAILGWPGGCRANSLPRQPVGA